MDHLPRKLNMAPTCRRSYVDIIFVSYKFKAVAPRAPGMRAKLLLYNAKCRNCTSCCVLEKYVTFCSSVKFDTVTSTVLPLVLDSMPITSKESELIMLSIAQNQTTRIPTNFVQNYFTCVNNYKAGVRGKCGDCKPLFYEFVLEKINFCYLCHMDLGICKKENTIIY